jgi:hypothetical protein
MDTKIVELAIEALEARKKNVEAEIQTLSQLLKSGSPLPAIKKPEVIVIAPKRRIRSAAEKAAQSKRMKAYWASKRKATAAPAAAAAKPKNNKKAAARKALSEKMKQIWAKRKAEAAKKSE